MTYIDIYIIKDAAQDDLARATPPAGQQLATAHSRRIGGSLGRTQELQESGGLVAESNTGDGPAAGQAQGGEGRQRTEEGPGGERLRPVGIEVLEVRTNLQHLGGKHRTGARRLLQTPATGITVLTLSVAERV